MANLHVTADGVCMWSMLTKFSMISRILQYADRWKVLTVRFCELEKDHAAWPACGCG